MEDLEKEFTKIDFKNYEIPKNDGGRTLKKNQRLALEIIKEFNINKRYVGRWFRACKNCPAFVEDKFLMVKSRKNITDPAAYLWRLIYNNKTCKI